MTTKDVDKAFEIWKSCPIHSRIPNCRSRDLHRAFELRGQIKRRKYRITKIKERYKALCAANVAKHQELIERWTRELASISKPNFSVTDIAMAKGQP